MSIQFIKTNHKPLLIGVFVAASCLLTLVLYPTAAEKTQIPVEVSDSAATGSLPSVMPMTGLSEPVVIGDEKAQPATESQDAGIVWVAQKYAPSLAGTEIDGNLITDADGNLVLSLDVKDFFDYFFSAVGEVSLDDAINEIQHQAELRLPPNAVEQVMGLLESYMAYQNAMQDIMAVSLVPENEQDYHYYSKVMAETFSRIKSLRREFFSPEAADAFFAMEERFSEYAVESIKIRADEGLTEAEKQQKMVELEALMPEQMRTAQEETRLTVEIASQARTMYEQGAGDEAIMSVLGQKYDEETIADMLAFYKREAIWQQRMSDFMALKSHIDNSDLAGDIREMQLQSLREEYFDQDEISRVLAHEAIARKQSASRG